MMPATRRHLLIGSIASVATLAMLVWFVPTPILIEVFSGVFLALAIMVAIVWIPGFIRIATGPSAAAKVVLLGAGIVLIWIGTAMQRTLSLLYRYRGKPEAWVDSPAWAVAIWILMMAAVLTIMASGTDDDGRFRDPERLLLYIGLPIAFAATLAFVVMQG